MVVICYLCLAGYLYCSLCVVGIGWLLAWFCGWMFVFGGWFVVDLLVAWFGI